MYVETDVWVIPLYEETDVWMFDRECMLTTCGKRCVEIVSEDT